jgi:hypothetical protein
MNFPQPEMATVEEYDLTLFQDGFVSLKYPPTLPDLINDLSMEPLPHGENELYRDPKLFKESCTLFFAPDAITDDLYALTETVKTKNKLKRHPVEPLSRKITPQKILINCTKVQWFIKKKALM